MMHHYLVADANAMTLFMAEAAPAGAMEVPPELFEQVFACVDSGTPCRIVNSALQQAPGPKPEPFLTWDFDAQAWIDARSDSEQWAAVRAQRTNLLRACDWTALPDAPLSNAARQAWANYRQALRDITQQADPSSITWPTPPGVTP